LFAASSTVQETPTSGKSASKKELLIQGNVLKGLLDYLTNKFQINKKYIVQHDKSSGKKK
jgi:hypothetical protein